MKKSATHLTAHIIVATAKWNKAFPKRDAKINEAARAALCIAAGLKKGKKEVNILLATDAAIKKLNRDWRGMDKPTNVLSFPAPPAVPGRQPVAGRTRAFRLPAHARTQPSLGDIILSYETIRRECRAENKTLENHTLHLVVHGMLHLLGYDHVRPKDAKVMEKLECDILGALGYPDPYHEYETENGATHGRRSKSKRS